MRLIIVDAKWNCTGEYLSELISCSQVLTQCGITIQLEPHERAVAPVETHDARAGAVYWLLKRSPQGEATLIPTPRGEVVYFSKAEVDARSAGERPFFPAMIAGDERWFLEVRAPIIEGDEDGELTYEEDGEASPDDSLGPADTVIVDLDAMS